MNYRDKILFENYFHMTKVSREVNNKYFNFVLNIILNSKEFLNTGANLLSLIVNHEFGSMSYFYATYSLGEENRDVRGTFIRKNGKVYLISDIYSFKDGKNFELGEIFELCSGSYSRFSTYSNSNSFDRVYISEVEFDKVDKFKEEAVKLIKKRG